MLVQGKSLLKLQLGVYVCSMNKQELHKRKTKMRNWLLIAGVFVGLLILVNQAKAQNDGIFIYGEIHTIDGDKYEGPIRWSGAETGAEAYWVEMFNAVKTSNDFMKFLSKSEQENLPKPTGSSWLGLDISSLNIWEDRYSRTNHQFDTQFGDIKSIEPSGKQSAKITLKNGVILEVNGAGHEDVGQSIQLYDQELGQITVKWSRIDRVDFKQGPAKLDYKFGDPIYGTVRTGRKGTFTGLIQWDADERFLEDAIDGEDRNGDKKIPFRSIKSITKERGGSNIVLNSGREFNLRGTNDVNDGNRGIVIFDPEIGKVTVPWRDFVDLEIIAEPKNIPSYDDFEISQGLTASVKTIDGDEYQGLIAYDLDEGWEFEILDGQDDDVVYEVLFRNIKRIIPKNYNYSTIELKNGKQLLLGDARDVSEDNAGVLIFTSGASTPVYVRWSKIDEIIFD